MIYESKKEHDTYIRQMLGNTTCDEVAFNIDFKPAIPNWETVDTLLRIEVAKAEEALKITKHYLAEFFTLIRMNACNEEMVHHMNLVSFTARDIMMEAMHVRAVAMRAVEQLQKEKAPADGNQL